MNMLVRECNMECPFCRRYENKDYILENDLAFAFFDSFPVSDGHVLIVPKRHIPDYWSTTAEEKVAILDLLDKAKHLVESKYVPDGYNVGINIGEMAGQTVMHLHVHLIPRYAGDVGDPKGGVRGVIPSKKTY